MQKIKPQFVRFAAVGALGTGCHYLVLIALVSLLGVTPGNAAFTGAAAGAYANYWMNRRYTFANLRPHREAIPRFVAMAAAGAGINGLIVGILSSHGAHYLLAQVFATSVILVLNFLISKKWIFQQTK